MNTKKLPVALQVYSVREAAEKDFAGTMAKVKAMGYDGVELAGLYDMSPAEMRSALDKAGLRAVSAHVTVGAMMSATEKTIDDYIAIGCDYVAISYLPEDMRHDSPNFDNILKEFARIGQACVDKGIKLLYHNHEFEFEKTADGSYMLDYMFAKVPASLLEAEPDTAWIKFSGLDPAEYIRKYTGRCPIVHLKDFTGDTRENMEFHPVGSGKQDVPAILQASLDCGAKWVVVEQDHSLTRPQIEAAKISREYLTSLGW